MMKRFKGWIFVALISIGLVMASQSWAVSLKNNTLITGDKILLSDLFSGLSEDKASKVLGPAPRPGQDMVLNARTLLRVALAMDLDWRPAHSGEFITLNRAATIIDDIDIEKAIKQTLSDKHTVGDKFRLSMDNAGYLKMVLPLDMKKDMEVTNLRYDPERKWFEARIVAPSRSNPHSVLNVQGRVVPLVSIPVLNRAIQNGEIIRQGDISMIDMVADTVNSDVILSSKTLIGQTPRRMVLAGKPVNNHDVQAPQIIERGQNVTMYFKNGPLSLTVIGRAMENGAKGDLIRVVNSASSQSVEAIVTGEREVTLASF